MVTKVFFCSKHSYNRNKSPALTLLPVDNAGGLNSHLTFPLISRLWSHWSAAVGSLKPNSCMHVCLCSEFILGNSPQHTFLVYYNDTFRWGRPRRNREQNRGVVVCALARHGCSCAVIKDRRGPVWSSSEQMRICWPRNRRCGLGSSPFWYLVNSLVADYLP